MNRKRAVWVALVGLAVGVNCVPPRLGAAQTSDATQATIAKRIGTIKAVSGNTLTLAPSPGAEVAVTVQPNARILRLGADKDLKSATPIQLQDLQVGDTIRVRGTASEDGKTFSALEVMVITHAAVAAVSDQIRQDWQKRGMGGRVEVVDAASGNITISIPSLKEKKTVVVHTTKTTIVYRYAPDSAKPEDAKPSTLRQVQAGDQLRARGDRNADGSEITAEEIYAGVFPQFAATVKSVDANTGTVSLQDLVTKKTVEVKVTPDSQLHKIPAQMAQGFAMQLKGGTAGGTWGGNGGGSQAGAQSTSAPAAPSGGSAPAANNAQASAHPGGWGGSGSGRSGGFDLQRMLSRMPSSTLADLNLQKGDAVIVLATEGGPTAPKTAITLLSGVEPILQAAPSASQAMMLTPWSLGGTPGGDASQ